MSRCLSMGCLSISMIGSTGARAQTSERPLLTPVQQRIAPSSQRRPAPSFSLVDARGETITLAALHGKVVLLDFWATWCGGCKLEIPWYMEFDQRYRQQGLAVVGVAMDEEGWNAVRPFLAKETDPDTGGHTAMQYPVVLGSETMGKQFGLTSMPLTLLIDRDGRIALSHSGVVNKGDFEASIRQLLMERAQH